MGTRPRNLYLWKAPQESWWSKLKRRQTKRQSRALCVSFRPMVLWTSTIRNVIFILFIDSFFKPAERCWDRRPCSTSSSKSHKRPVVSYSKGHQPPTVPRPMKIQSWLCFTLSFPRCIRNPFTQAKLQARRPFLFLNGGCSGGETEGPKQKGGSEEVWELESERCGPHTELPSDTGERLILVDREAVSRSPRSPCQHPS